MKKTISILAVLILSVLQLFAVNITTDTAVGDASNTFAWRPGDRGTIEISGDFGSGTLTLYRWIGTGDPITGTGEWVAFSGASFSDDGGVEFVTGMRYLSISLSGSTSADLNYFIVRIP